MSDTKIHTATSSQHPLQLLTILITRPAQQAKSLCLSIESLGAKAISLPSIMIEPIPLSATNQKRIQSITANDLVIFLSANAVLHSQQHWKTTTTLPKIFAIGPGTAETLKEVGLPITGIPPIYCSEGLLLLNELTQVNDKRVFICSGTDSRPLLAKTLIERGASVIPIICYKRRRPKPNPEMLKLLRQPTSTITITTSRDGLTNFAKIITAAKIYRLFQQPILVAHPKYQALALELGFKKIITVEDPTDAKIITKLIQYQNTANSWQQADPGAER